MYCITTNTSRREYYDTKLRDTIYLRHLLKSVVATWWLVFWASILFLKNLLIDVLVEKEFTDTKFHPC